MFFDKNFMIILLFIIHMPLVVLSGATDNFGFYTNLSDNEKMYLIIGALDEGLVQILTTFQNNQDAEQLCALLSAGLEKNKAIFSALNINMHPNLMYLTFLENAYFLSKYGKTAEFLATLSAVDRTNIITSCYNCWLASYTAHLNLNLSYMIDDLNEYFAIL